MKWPALRFNQLVLGFAQDTDRAVLAERAAQAPEDILPLTDLLTKDWTQVAAHGGLLDRRPLPGGVDHRPHDHLVRRERQGPRASRCSRPRRERARRR